MHTCVEINPVQSDLCPLQGPRRFDLRLVRMLRRAAFDDVECRSSAILCCRLFRELGTFLARLTDIQT